MIVDSRYAVRTLRRTPAFTTVALLSLGLGIGATSAVFSLVNAVHLSALPYPQADRLVLVDAADTRPECARGCTRRATYTEFGGWVGHVTFADGLTAFQGRRAVLVSANGADVIDGAAVSADFLPLLGFTAAIGRLLDRGDESSAANDVVVLGGEAWRRYFGGDPKVVGTTIRLDETPYDVVGVLPPSARVGRPLVSTSTPTASFFVPLKPASGAASLSDPRVSVLARLGPARTPQQLSDELRPLLDPSIGSTATSPHVWGPRLTPLRAAAARTYQSSYWTLLGAVAFVLLIACVNLAGLFVTRLMARRRELAIQAALGAGRGRLVRQMLAEVALIAGGGGVLGVAFAAAGMALARRLPADQIPFWTSFSLDGRVLLFALAATVITGVVFGVWPALLVSRGRLQSAVREAGGTVVSGGSRVNLRTVLVALEIACTTVLLTGSGLLVRAFVEADARDLGMERRQVLEAHVTLPDPRYGGPGPRQQFAEALLERAARLPGVQSAALLGRAARAPAAGITVEGASEVSPNSALTFGAWDVTPDYFRTVGIAMIAGRPFSAADVAGAVPVAILDDPTARRLFPDGRVLGRQVKLGPPASPEPWLTVVGVTATAHGDPLRQVREYFPVLYRALAQVPDPGLTISLRTAGDPHGTIEPLREAVRGLDATLPVTGVQSVDDAFRDWLWPLRFNTMVMTSFAVFALALAAIGVYGVIAALVAQRTREIGIRVALGARRGDVLRLVMRSGALLAASGLGAGIVGSLALTRVLQSLLYGASTTDPLVFAAAVLVFAAVALAATYLPARRALGVTPLVAFKADE